MRNVAQDQQNANPETACFSKALERFRGFKFSSRSEAAFAILAERFIPGWECKAGETCHIRIGPKEIDFNVRGAWVEYHPTTRWDWESTEGAAGYGEHFRTLSPQQKKESWLAIKKEFAHRYYRERRLVLDLTGHRDEPLIVCRDAYDVYHGVIRRFGADYPPEKDFVRLWDRLLTGKD